MNKLTTCSVFVNSVFVRYACKAPAVGNLKNGKPACALHLRREKEDYESLRIRQTEYRTMESGSVLNERLDK